MRIKRLYYDLRQGQSVIFPIVSLVNFIIISYSLTNITNLIPFRFYIPIVVITMIVSLIVIGNVFRKKQQSTDFALSYEQNTELVRTLDAILSQDKDKINERIVYHKKILK